MKEKNETNTLIWNCTYYNTEHAENQSAAWFKAATTHVRPSAHTAKLSAVRYVNGKHANRCKELVAMLCLTGINKQESSVRLQYEEQNNYTLKSSLQFNNTS